MTTKSYKDALERTKRSDTRGIGKSRSNDPGAECCPICWSKNCCFVAHHWDIKDAMIMKCLTCSHHSVRTVEPTIMSTISNNDLFLDRENAYYESKVAEIVKNLFTSKTQNKAELNILLPTLKSGKIISFIEKAFEPASRSRYKSIKNRRANNTPQNTVPERAYYGLLDVSVDLEETSFNKTTYKLLDVYPKSYSFIKRADNIANKINDMTREINKFDLVISADLLSQAIDPEILIDTIISNCDYFIILVPRTTSREMKTYAAEIANDIARIERKTQKSPNYPIKPHVYLDRFCRQQIQFFSESSLYNLIAQRYEKLKDGNLPKGKARGLKTCKIVGISEDYIVAHNIPERFYESF